ncbi:MAG: ABC transporter ATP-binding protein [Solobacterium sp.]|nr:ABC transporter ATP-binding protein [Erysipelotrichaceae bacterium]MBQ1318655.1 ABC transporter ATP-binding protein [Solobacterium sp.]MBQ1321752.1 ABC transporter ATP-binding protein [Solobacterium sp.]MBQ1355102.1 ABC transporter ATP-binding protein [Solobacterium sp.]
MELILEDVTKQYAGTTAVKQVSLDLHPGVTGLLGANGAGKTTLMRMICGILRPTAGTVCFRTENDILNASEELYRDALGYLPQDFGYYPDFTGREFLMYMAALKGIDKRAAKRKCEELLQTVNLEKAADKKIKTYSGGMKQRLGIAQAVLNEPRILILDEPTAGLDPKERVRFRNLIADLGRDAIVILSTHIVSDVEHIADRILMMKDGSIVFDGQAADIQGDLETFYLKTFGGEDE